MGFGDLAKTLALLPVPMDPIVIEFERTASDGAAFELGSRMRARSTIRMGSSSAIAPMITAMARPSAAQRAARAAAQRPSRGEQRPTMGA